MDTSFSIAWSFTDDALYEKRPNMLPRELMRRLFFEDAAKVWANLIQGWPLANGSPMTLPDGNRFKVCIHAVFEPLGGNPQNKARVDVQEVLENRVAGFPSRGTIRIDLDDIDQLIADPARFKQTIVHEIGHVLGLGTLFDSVGLVGGEAGNPVYTGEQGSRAFAALLDREGSIHVPLQEEPEGTTRAFHWDECALRLDIMSTRLDEVFVPANPDGIGESNVISTVSAGALVDLGYRVNMLRADRVPASLQRRAATAAGGAPAESDAGPP